MSDNLIEQEEPRLYLTSFIGPFLPPALPGTLTPCYQIIARGDFCVLQRTEAMRVAAAILKHCGIKVQRFCRGCGCTDEAACIEHDLAPCHWVELDLCSECA